MKLVTYPYWRDQTPSWGGGGVCFQFMKRWKENFFAFTYLKGSLKQTWNSRIRVKTKVCQYQKGLQTFGINYNREKCTKAWSLQSNQKPLIINFFFFGFPYGKKRQIFVLGIIKRKWSEPQGETFLRKTYLSASHPCPRANVALLRGPCKNCSW